MKTNDKKYYNMEQFNYIVHVAYKLRLRRVKRSFKVALIFYAGKLNTKGTNLMPPFI